MPAQAWVTLIVGVVGLSGLIAGLMQKTLADKRSEWWRRVTWAVDHTLSDNLDAQVVGFDLLGELQAAKLATRADRSLFVAWLTPQALPDEPEWDDTEVEEVP